MRTDYFDDLLPDSVTTVTRRKPELVTPEKEKVTSKNSDLGEALPVLPLLPTKTGNTGVNEAPHALRVFQYRLTDNPAAWLVLIAPGCDLDEATESLQARFGKRLIEVRGYQ